MHSANSHETKCIQNQLGKMQFLHIKVYQNFCAFYIFLTLSGPGGGGGGGGGYKAWMTKFKNFLLYDVQTW